MAKKSRKGCEIVDTSAIFKSDVWEHLSFPMSGNNEGEKATDGQKIYAHTALFWHFFAHTVKFTVQSLFIKGQMHFLYKSASF